jgi:hypothetical protein
MAAPEGSNRGFQLLRKGAAISDMSRLAYNQGPMTFDSAVENDLLTKNAVHMVGIATQTESRLDATRYPIRVVIAAQPPRDERYVTCFGFWRVVDGGHSNVTFERRSVITDRMGQNIRTLFPNLDDDWWNWRNDRINDGTFDATTGAIDATLAAHQLTVMNAIALAAIPDETVAAARTAYAAILLACTTANRYPYIQIGPGLYIEASPVGTSFVAAAPLTVNQTVGFEVALTVKVNALALKNRYPTAADGAINLGAHAIAMMFKMGLQETFEHREFVTVYVSPVAAAPTTFTVNSIVAPAGYTPPAHIALTSVIDRSDVRTSREMIELGNLLVFTSGLMHYLFNHTTGGTRVTGTLATILHGRNIIHNGMPMAEAEMVTSIMYECLHPVNKRAIANLMYRNSKVYSHAKSNHARPYAQFQLDSFVQIRKNPYPAGSHKAFTLTTGLKRLVQAGFANFLPWYASLPECIEQCRGILNSGARAHVGAHYYTGMHPISQTSSLDVYLPEVAAYIQIFHRNDSLAMSPHLSLEVSSRCFANWATLLKSLKSKDLSDASVEDVQAYLASIGQATVNIDLKQPSTWGAASLRNAELIQSLDRVFE